MNATSRSGFYGRAVADLADSVGIAERGEDAVSDSADGAKRLLTAGEASPMPGCNWRSSPGRAGGGRP